MSNNRLITLTYNETNYVRIKVLYSARFNTSDIETWLKYHLKLKPTTGIN